MASWPTQSNTGPHSGRSVSCRTKSAFLPTSSEPIRCDRPMPRAPWRVVSSRMVWAGSRSWSARASRNRLAISRPEDRMSAAMPSVPKRTSTPRSSISGNRPICESPNPPWSAACGQWMAAAPDWTSRSSSPRSIAARWVSITVSPSAPMSDRCSSGRRP